MNTSQIMRAMKGEKLFIGVFPCDKIPAFKVGGVIINTQPSSEPGQHWVALFLPGDGSGQYMDSFGFPPMIKEIILFISQHCPRGCIYNSVAIQRLTSEECGRFCTSFLKCKFRNESFQHIISKFNSTEERALAALSRCGESNRVYNRN